MLLPHMGRGHASPLGLEAACRCTKVQFAHSIEVATIPLSLTWISAHAGPEVEAVIHEAEFPLSRAWQFSGTS